MRTLRLVLIASIVVSQALAMQGCASRSVPAEPSQAAAALPAKNAGGTAFFRHRWWNYYERGILQAEERRLDAAEADFSAAIDLRDADQRMARTYGMHFIDYFPSRELGIVYYESGRYDAALEAMERSIASAPSAKAFFFRDQIRRAIIQKSGQTVAPPRLDLELGASEVWTRQDPVMIEGTARDDHYIQGISINAEPVFQEGSQKTLRFQIPLSLPEGRHSVTASAVNLMGRSLSRTVVINVDRHGPLVALEQITPAGQTSSQRRSYIVRGVITDAAGVASVSLNDAALSIQSATEVPFEHLLPADRSAIRIKASDRLGNVTSAEFEVASGMPRASQPLLLAAAEFGDGLRCLASFQGRGDRQGPEIELKGWTGTQTVFLEKVYIDGMVSDPDKVVRLTVNQSPILNRPAQMAYFNQIVPLAEGVNTITVEAEDGHGNTSSKRITILRKIPQALTLDARLKVTVLPFETQGNLSAAGLSFQDRLLDALFHRNRFRLVERNTLDVILGEQKLSQTALIDQPTALRVGRLAAAQAIIAGNIIETRQGIEIVSRMIDTETSDILALEDVYSETKDRPAIQALAEGMAIKYHRDFPLVGGVVVNKRGQNIITDLGEQKIKLQRRIVVYKELPIFHPQSGKALGVDKEILCRARIIMVDAEISKAKLLDEPSDEALESRKVIAE